jgi:hypothetical protein
LECIPNILMQWLKYIELSFIVKAPLVSWISGWFNKNWLIITLVIQFNITVWKISENTIWSFYGTIISTICLNINVTDYHYQSNWISSAHPALLLIQVHQQGGLSGHVRGFFPEELAFNFSNNFTFNLFEFNDLSSPNSEWYPSNDKIQN